eukprot:m51a1_g7165 hypothetical protein (864) ;mRNA; f:52142-55331
MRVGALWPPRPRVLVLACLALSAYLVLLQAVPRGPVPSPPSPPPVAPERTTPARPRRCSNGWDARGVSHLRAAYLARSLPAVSDAFELDGELFVVLNLRTLRGTSASRGDPAWGRASFACVFGTPLGPVTVRSTVSTWDPSHGLTWLVRCPVPESAVDAGDSATATLVSTGPNATWPDVEYCRVPRPARPRGLVSCTWARNVPGARLLEWVAFHRLQGVEHFYVYANEPAWATAEALARYVETGVATVVDWDFGNAQADFHDQQAYIASCVHRQRGGRALLAAVHDVDDFFYSPKRGVTVRDWAADALRRDADDPHVAAYCSASIEHGSGGCPQTESTLVLATMCNAHDVSTYRTKCLFVPDNVLYPNVHHASKSHTKRPPASELLSAHMKRACADTHPGKEKPCHVDTELLQFGRDDMLRRPNRPAPRSHCVNRLTVPMGLVLAVCIVSLLPASYLPAIEDPWWFSRDPDAVYTLEPQALAQCVGGWDVRGVEPLRAEYERARLPAVADAFELDGELFVVLNLRNLPTTMMSQGDWRWQHARFSCVFNVPNGTVQSTVKTWDPSHGLTWLVRCPVPKEALGSLRDYRTRRNVTIVSENPGGHWAPFTFCRVPPPKRTLPLVACTSIKAADPLKVVEWIAHHKLQGYERLYIYSNEPMNATAKLLQTYVKEGVAAVIDWDFGHRIPDFHDQQSYIASCVHRHRGGRARLVGIFDIDEYFYVPKAGRTVAQRLLAELDANKTLEHGGYSAISAGTIHHGPGRCPPMKLRFNGTLQLSRMCARHNASTYRTKCHFLPDNSPYPNVHDAGGFPMHLLDPKEFVHAHLKQACQAQFASKPCFTEELLLRYVPSVAKEVMRVLPETRM